jgi:hypothetical protein
MIPTIGMMIASYTTVRLLQIAIETRSRSVVWLSIVGSAAIGYCAIELLAGGLQTTLPSLP